VRRPGSLTEADLERIVNGDVVDGGAIPDQAQALRYRVVRGVTIGPEGQLADYKIQGQLDRPSDQGGWIVQNVRDWGRAFLRRPHATLKVCAIQR
jgi:hypothetical protein